MQKTWLKLGLGAVVLMVILLLWIPETQEQKPAPCIVTGCSGQICAEEETITTCEWREEYGCFQTVVCERQKNGACDWTQTEELRECINQKRDGANANVEF